MGLIIINSTELACYSTIVEFVSLETSKASPSRVRVLFHLYSLLVAVILHDFSGSIIESTLHLFELEFALLCPCLFFLHM